MEGQSLFNFEDAEDFGGGITFTGTVNGNTYNFSFGTQLSDVNDAPTTITHNGGAVQGGVANADIGILSAVDEDDIFNVNDNAVLTYAVELGQPNSDLFTIDNTTKMLKLAPGKSLSFANAPGNDAGGHFYEVTIRVTDGGGYDTNTQQNPGSLRRSFPRRR